METAVDGEEALDKLLQKEYHLLVSDIRMPHMYGIELLKEVKENFPDVGVTMMAAYSDSFTV